MIDPQKVQESLKFLLKVADCEMNHVTCGHLRTVCEAAQEWLTFHQTLILQAAQGHAEIKSNTKAEVLNMHRSYSLADSGRLRQEP